MPAKLPPIAIVGAGLSGLTLGQCLKRKGIAAVIYDRAQSSPRYNYGITLHSSTYRPLLTLLGLDEAAFIEKLAVNAQQGGNGKLSNQDAFRCHRGRLETLMRDGLSITWDHRLTEVQTPSEPQQTGTCTALFHNGTKIDTSCLISCEGPHSMVRQSLSSGMKLDVLPYATFNGTRRIELDEYMQTIHKHMQDRVMLQQRHRDVYLEISISDISSSTVSISYIYSRPARDGADPLYTPDRPIAGATDIPDEFFDELDGLTGLESPFQEVFNSEQVREDRLLNWLMRSLTPNEGEAHKLSQNGIVLIGDAVHAVPILGGQGAKVAIKDGLDLAEYISANGVENFEAFTQSRLDFWKSAVEDSKAKIAELHALDSSHL